MKILDSVFTFDNSNLKLGKNMILNRIQIINSKTKFNLSFYNKKAKYYCCKGQQADKIYGVVNQG